MLRRFFRKIFTSAQRPLVIAHRGASAAEPENTLRAFQTAYRMGADGIECDIMHTRDHKLIVSHDVNLKRLVGVDRDIDKMNYAEILAYDFGKGERAPLLEDVFDHFLKKFFVINVEIKPVLFSGGIENDVAGLIKKFKCAKKIVVSSFFPLHIKRIKALVPEVRIGYLLSATQGFVLRNKLALHWANPDTLHLDHALYHDPKQRRIFDLPQPKWVWTINNENLLRFWLQQPVEAVITNCPDEAVKLRVA
jgi:glycerophosphoryl diester phosphodiesterase